MIPQPDNNSKNNYDCRQQTLDDKKHTTQRLYRE